MRNKLLELDLITDDLPVCSHDNLFFFSEDGAVTMDDHLIECGEGEESLIDLSGSWIVDGNQLTIIQDGQEESPYVLQVENQTSNSIDLVFPEILGGIEAQMTYVKLMLIGTVIVLSLKYNPNGLLPEVPYRPERPEEVDLE